MSAILTPRDYQLEAIAELHRRWDAGDTRVPMVLATGLGKTVIFAHLIADWSVANPSRREYVPSTPCEILCTPERAAALMLHAKPVDK